MRVRRQFRRQSGQYKQFKLQVWQFGQLGQFKLQSKQFRQLGHLEFNLEGILQKQQQGVTSEKENRFSKASTSKKQYSKPRGCDYGCDMMW